MVVLGSWVGAALVLVLQATSTRAEWESFNDRYTAECTSSQAIPFKPYPFEVRDASNKPAKRRYLTVDWGVFNDPGAPYRGADWAWLLKRLARPKPAWPSLGSSDWDHGRIYLGRDGRPAFSPTGGAADLDKADRVRTPFVWDARRVYERGELLRRKQSYSAPDGSAVVKMPSSAGGKVAMLKVSGFRDARQQEDMENEVSAHRVVQGADYVLPFLGFVRHHGKVVGFLVEYRADLVTLDRLTGDAKRDGARLCSQLFARLRGEAGIAHGDQHGGNCLLTPDGKKAWLIDLAQATIPPSGRVR